MSESKRWREVRAQRPLNEDRVARYSELIDMQMSLAQLRGRRGHTQAQIARQLDVSQPNISRIEQEDDIFLSTLMRFVKALGGRVEIHAIFDDETIPLLLADDDPLT